MSVVVRGLASALLCLTLSAPAYAETAQDLYVAGHYDQAIAQGVAENNAVGLTTAAHAALAEATLRDDACMDCLKQAEDFARRAIAGKNTPADAHLYLAAALGYQGRIIGPIATKLKGYPEEAKVNLDIALKDDPDNARGWAALAGWNIAIVNGGGATLARWLYGATEEKGVADFARAFRLDPNDIGIRFQYALTMSAFDREKYRADIIDALERTVNGKPDTKYDTIMQDRARELLSLLKKGDLDAYDARVHWLQGYR